ncbi:MAG TPA: TolC family outer membrane protein [Aquabacterium sp.]|uniref:TolC family outer membrane protein n=1 Tax=Aquabacterium sp. TaxID=1872578 RepID=UPI002E335F12|nr:TolC family outer membrane protein [Aquabacterium sp.]HEX5373250.1 TolC family outer membrane protein [Aquabacterium sp.]
MINSNVRNAVSATALAVMCLAAQAQTPSATGLAGAAQKAIANNPEVTARFNALRASANEVDVARGGLLPQVNLSADGGRGYDNIRGRSPNEGAGVNRASVGLSVSQVLWDGLSTKKEVERLGHARLTRYFEFLNASEETALEATRAYIDVQRYRRLVELAEDNYVQHKYAFDQLQSKVKAGVGRGVDSEQANARLALADSNLTTEVANLHDVSSRYLRVVGEAPEARQEPVKGQLDKGVAGTSADAVAQALSRNASVSAAIENLRSVERQSEARQSAFQPKVEARARTAFGKNMDGIVGQRRDSVGEIVLNWNLYNGGSDQARVRQYADLVSQAADLRDKACRDVRQTVAIAHNDIRKLQDQLTALDRNVLAIEKARDAYRQQFDIGQRSLLDLLNAENELYTAKRAYANAEHDLLLAYARTHAATNTLVPTLGLTRTDDGSAELAANWQAAEDAAQRCPASTVAISSTARSELDERARKMAVPVKAAPVAAPAVTPAPVAPASMAPAVKTVEQRLRDWVATWMAKDVNKYMTFYAKDFAPARMSSAKWITERRRLVGKAGPIEIRVDDVKAEAKGQYVVTSFKQVYNSQDYKDSTLKTLTWRQINGDWVIFKESNR